MIRCTKHTMLILCSVILLLNPLPAQESHIQPYDSNPYYWQYNGEPVMLLGGSKDDNLFQIPNLEAHLDLMQSVGANYIRNTMSSRDEGNVQPFQQLEDRMYDLDQWNAEYWQRFENMLEWTSERDIIVQIEVWAFHDFYGEWEEFLPWNPRYNVNYTAQSTQLDTGSYGSYWETRHDFFYTVPALHNDTEVLRYQQAFVDKILSYSLEYGHVLYCMTNEIFTQYSPEWGWYWAEYIENRALEAGVVVQVAEMYQNHDLTHEQHRATLDHPEIYDFIDISQNSRQLDDRHWERLQWVREYIADQPRPINHNKTYGGDEVAWTDGDEHGIERFWRNIIGGTASVRFHRPPSGIGLNERAQAQIQSARMLLESINIYDCQPDEEHTLLSERDEDEAYLTYMPGKEYALYFPEGGSIQLDLTDANGQFTIQWLHIEKSEWTVSKTIHAGEIVRLDIPEQGKNWAAVIKK
ncbi:MAG: hypothetical protein GF372_04895 [Candidatus Marinimicrobia bacterium]|nr:hypothetical protein [Candidatus Neomarinimicrobiota bacterium]